MSTFLAGTVDVLRRTPVVVSALLAVSQIFAGMAGSHDAAVGPRKTYLGILLRRDDPAAIPG